MKCRFKKHYPLYLLFFLLLGILITGTLIKVVIREKVVEVTAVEPERAVASVIEVAVQVPAAKPRSIDQNINLLLGLNRSLERIKAVSSLNKEAKLTSKQEFGMQAETGYALTNYFTVLGTMSMDRRKFLEPANFTLNQDKTLAFSVAAGIRYKINRYFSLDELFGFKQNYMFYATSANEGNIDRFSNKLFITRFNYYYFRGNNFDLGGNIALELLLPIEKPNFETTLGYSINPELQFSWNVSRRDAVYLSLGFKYFNLKRTTHKQTGMMGLLGIGFTRREADW